ncbi:MAG: aryl-sulfate sulfotransferase [Bacteroidota bacterium]
MIDQLKMLTLCLVLFANTIIAQPLHTIVNYKQNTPAKGYYFMAPFKMRKEAPIINGMLLILNGQGQIIRYQYIDKISDFKIQSNGLMSYYHDRKYFLMDKNFTLIDSVSCIGNIETDTHDFIILPNGHYLIMGTETQIEDYSAKPLFLQKQILGSRNAKVKYGVIQEIDQNKKVVFQWTTKGIYKPEDADPFYLNDTLNVDLTHFNSVDMNKEGDIIVSIRYFNEVVKVKRADSSIIWRMGGKRNEIKVMNDTIPFYGQHDARFTKNKQFTLFDNSYTLNEQRNNVRALEYYVDDQNKTAKLVWNYSRKNKLISEATGNTQRLPNNYTLINYGKIEKGTPNITFEVVNEKNESVFELGFTDTVGTYRAFFYPTIPAEINHAPVELVKIKNEYFLQTKKKFRHYEWSNGKKKARIKITKNGQYCVYTSNDNNAFTRSEIINITQFDH